MKTVPYWINKARRAPIRRRILRMALILVGGNIAAWSWALSVFAGRPALLGTALIAYGFGLRHAVDADHIAAIDNVTRKLVAEGARPIATGFFFSLGHSTIVILASVALALMGDLFAARFEAWRAIGGVIGTSVSAGFLLLIAAMNLCAVGAIWRAFRAAPSGESKAEQEFERLFPRNGVLARFSRPLFALVGTSWHMYPLGVLFGLGFDTATEIGLLGISATEASKGLPVWSILVFPALFTAGMSLVDTMDGVLMLGAYGWASIRPIGKLRYNLTITLISVMVAVIIGGTEALGLIDDQLGLDGPVARAVAWLNEHLTGAGFGIVGLFVLAWMLALVFYPKRRALSQPEP